MKRKIDPSRIKESKFSTESEIDYRNNLEKLLENTSESNVEKLENFANYVTRQRLAKFVARYEIFKKVLNVQGSIFECGVYLGQGVMTFAQLSAILEPVNHQRQIVGFDTFTGFAKISREDRKGVSTHSKKGGLAVNSYANLKRAIALYDSNRSLGHIQKVSLIKGNISRTLPKYLKDNPQTIISLLNLDLDIFEPTKVAIKHAVPRMPRGAIIVFDELNSGRWPGETLALIKTIGIKNLRIERFPFDSCISYATIE